MLQYLVKLRPPKQNIGYVGNIEYLFTKTADCKFLKSHCKFFLFTGLVVFAIFGLLLLDTVRRRIEEDNVKFALISYAQFLHPQTKVN